tara:strand:- start:1916 stop:2812 length:897 start_codon:yes stop_codon:yes gene_type:complete
LKKKILIFGSSGFFGRNLIKVLLKQNIFRIVCLTKNRKNFISPLIKNIHIKKINFLNFEKKLKLKKFDFVINFAGNINHSNKSETFEAHYKLVKKIVNYIKETNSGYLIQAGSSLEYGRIDSPQKESNVCSPNSCYGKAKFLSTKYIAKNLKKYVIVRPYQVYGPFQKKDRLIPIIIDSCLKNKKFACTEGKQKRDFLFIDDFIELMLKILKTKKIQSGIYNVGNGKSVQVKRVIALIKNKIGKGIPMYGKIKMRKDETKVLYPNLTKVKKTFKWRSKTSLGKGIIKTINFYKRQNAI